MNTSEFTVRTAETADDCTRLEALYDAVFAPEEVGKLAHVLFHHHPSLNPKNWLMAEHTSTGELAAACVLIPWQWTWFTQPINVAEQGIVATLPKYQGKGLQKLLNQAIDKKIEQSNTDFAIIQGIPGFYQKFGYHYSLPIDNHVNLEWRCIPAANTSNLNFREATKNDIAFLVEQDRQTALKLDSANLRDEATWGYLLTHSKETDYGSDIWIGEQNGNPSIYCRRNVTGFGNGLIVSEVSENLTYEHAIELLNFIKTGYETHQKPYLRLNLSNDSTLSRIAMQLGALEGQPYGFQIKVPNIQRWLTKQTSLFSQRLSETELSDFSGLLRLDFYSFSLDLSFENGQCLGVSASNRNQSAAAGARIPLELIPALVLGRHTLHELRKTRPDIAANNAFSKRLLAVLFPTVTSWHHIPY